MVMFSPANTKWFIGPVRNIKLAEFVETDFPTIGSNAWTEIAEAEAAGTLSTAAAEIVFDSITANRKRRFKGARETPPLTLSFGRDVSNKGQQALYAAEATDFNYAFRVDFTDISEPLTGPCTITIAAPGVIAAVAHGLDVGSRVRFTTTGALPTGLAANTTYHVVSVTADTFQVAVNRGGTPIATTGTQSGTHTFTSLPSGTQRMFIGLVAQLEEALDSATDIVKLKATIWPNCKMVNIDARP